MRQKRKARELSVAAVSQLTPNMRRVTLHGEDLRGFPDNASGAYFKLVFPGDNPDKPILRTYTVAQHRPSSLEIDVDFMLHTNTDGSASGVAATWAAQAQVGDSMSIFGPGLATFINVDADWFLLVADMTALPALTASLALLPADAKGYIVIEIVSREDQQDLQAPDGMEFIWVVNPSPGSDSTILYSAITGLEWQSGEIAVWAACEFSSMKKIRHYLKQEKRVKKSHLYVSSYWKKGLQEEEHKIVKKEDAA